LFEQGKKAGFKGGRQLILGREEKKKKKWTGGGMPSPELPWVNNRNSIGLTVTKRKEKSPTKVSEVEKKTFAAQ